MKSRWENTIFALITLIYFIYTPENGERLPPLWCCSDCPFKLCRPRSTDHIFCVRDLCEHTDNRFTLGYARLQCTTSVSLYIVILCSKVYCYHIINNVCIRRALGLIYKSVNISGNPLGTGLSESYMRAQCVYTKVQYGDLPH